MAGPQAAGNAGGSTKQAPKPELVFEDAVRPATNCLMALTGPSSSGKTQSALAMATGMGTKIGLCDTERGRASHYAGLFPFKHLRMPDDAPQTLVRALAVGADQGIDVMIIDSGSHYWSGKSGVLAQVDQKTDASRSKNAFTSGWKEIKPVEHDMWEAVMAYPGHVIMTLRVKTAYELVENDRGKKEPTKIGLKPDQRSEVEYEFDIVGDMDMSHTMTVSKCSFPGLWYPGQRIELPNTEHGAAIVNWLNEGARLTTIREYVDRIMNPEFTFQQLRHLYQGELSQRGLLGAALFDPETGEQTTLGNLVIRLGVARNPQQGAGTTRAAAAADAADQTETRKAG
jgi:hypothetical protein